MKPRRETVAQTNVAGFTEGSARENEQQKNSTSSSEGEGWPPRPFASFLTQQILTTTPSMQCCGTEGGAGSSSLVRGTTVHPEAAAEDSKTLSRS